MERNYFYPDKNIFLRVHWPCLYFYRLENIFTIIKMHYRMSSLQFHRLIDCMSREETKLLYLDHVAFWYSPVLVDQTAQVGSRGGDSVLKTERD